MDLATFTKSRKARGLEIARTMKIVRATDHLWSVPSQHSAGGKYVVDVRTNTCSCEDFETHGLPCKHIHAVQFARDPTLTAVAVETIAMNKQNKPEGNVSKKAEEEKKPRPTYPQPSWPAYRRAQLEEKPGGLLLMKDLFSAVQQPPYKGRGRPALPLGDALLACAVKVWTCKSSFLAAAEIRQCVTDGIIDVAPHPNSVLKLMGKSEVTPILKELIAVTAMPLAPIETDFAVDATGFSTSNHIRWFDHKWGKKKKWQKFLKAHVMTGTETHVVTSVEITVGNRGDSLEFGNLVRSTAERFNVVRVSADKAYLSNKNLALVDELGAVPFVPFKSNSRLGKGGEVWKRLWHLFHAQKSEFMERYHRRSNVETTFSMIKRRYGGAVRAKTFVAQTNEILLKILVHNINCVVHAIHELGIDPKFWTPAASTEEAAE